MFKKRLLSVIAILCIIAVSLAGCSGNTAGKTEAGSPAKDTKEMSPPKYSILQDRVFELTYDDYDMAAGLEIINNKYDIFGAGGCSAVKLIVDGKVYVGRNYDFYCTDTPAFVVRNNSGKYRTIGIGNSPLTLQDWEENYTIAESLYSILPLICCDVMNEKGLYIETNIRVSEEGLQCSGTNPGKERRCTQAFMQTMLSNYETIDEILAHIDDYDWFDLSKLGFCQSFLLADSSGRSVVIEFAANSWKASENDYNANFFINNEYFEKENYPIGEGRISKILSGKPYVRSEEDIFTMMELGKYSQFYKADCDVDMAIAEYTRELGYTRFTVKEDMENARLKMQAMLDEYDTYSWEEQIQTYCWESTFITVANLSDLQLNVHFSEHYGVEFKVSFN